MSESFPLISIELKVLKIVCIYWNSPCTELLDEEKESCRLSCFQLLSRNILFCFKLISSRKPTIGHKSELLLQSVIPVLWAHVKQWCLPREEYVSRLGGGWSEGCEAKTMTEVKRTCASWCSAHSRETVILSWLLTDSHLSQICTQRHDAYIFRFCLTYFPSLISQTFFRHQLNKVTLPQRCNAGRTHTCG